MTAIDKILGRTPRQNVVSESTTTGSMPAVVASPIVVEPPSRSGKKIDWAVRLKKLKARKNPSIHEDDDDQAIPDNAKPDLGASGNDSGQMPTDGGAAAPIRHKDQQFIDTSVSLVAPMTTPGWDKPLDPSQVPSATSSTTTPPTTAPVPPPAATGTDVLRTLIGAHAESFNPALIQQADTAAVVERVVSGGAVNTGLVKENVAAAGKAAEAVAAAHSGAPSTHHFNPGSMAHLTSVTRKFM